jgi:hypothetical protein
MRSRDQQRGRHKNSDQELVAKGPVPHKAKGYDIVVNFKERLAGKKTQKPADPLKLYETLDRAHDKGPLRPVALAPIWDTNRAPLDRACRLHTVTLAGLHPRARTIMDENLDLNPPWTLEGYTSDRLMAALLHDLLAMGA